MSFSTETKIAAAKLPKSNTEEYSMLYGMLLFAQKFDNTSLVIHSETPEVIDILCGLLLGIFDLSYAPTIKEKAGKSFYEISISNSNDLNKLLSEFNTNPGHINRSLFKSPMDELSFVKGAFLTCGYINSPDKSYRLDFTVNTPDLAVDLAVSLEKTVGVMPKLSVRKDKQIVYYRGSSTIVDVLNMLGLNNSAFILMNSQIEREIRNNLNRKNNFDIANMQKTSKVANDQIDAINWLINNQKFEQMSMALKSIAKLRIEQPDASLEVLGQNENPPISKSQVSKRLKQVIDYYEKEKNN